MHMYVIHNYVGNEPALNKSNNVLLKIMREIWKFVFFFSCLLPNVMFVIFILLWIIFLVSFYLLRGSVCNYSYINKLMLRSFYHVMLWHGGRYFTFSIHPRLLNYGLCPHTYMHAIHLQLEPQWDLLLHAINYCWASKNRMHLSFACFVDNVRQSKVTWSLAW